MAQLQDPAGTAADSQDVTAIAALLARTETFSCLGPLHLQRLAAGCPVERYAAGARLFEQGETGSTAYLVLSGEVAIEVETQGGRVTVAVIGEGGLVGEIAAFAATTRTAGVAALGQVALLRIDQAKIRGLLLQNPDLAMTIISGLGQRLQSLNGTIATLIQAANALAHDTFEPDMLDVLRREATRFSHFADVFENMAREITKKRRHAQEMQTAREIQRSFLPVGIEAGPHAGRFEIAAAMTPAAQVGGDFFDYFMIDADRLAFAVGDVSGKGVPAAMFMSVARMVLKTLAREGGSAGDVLRRVNRLLAEDNGEGMFVTIAFARLDLRNGEMDLASGGHEEVFVIDPAGQVEKADTMGPALGIADGAQFGTRALRLTPGSTVVLASDGVTEAFAPDRAMFGIERLVSCLEKGHQAAAAELVAAVEADVAAFADGCAQSDDLTCLALRYLG